MSAYVQNQVMFFLLASLFEFQAFAGAADCNVNILNNPSLSQEVKDHFSTPFDQLSSNTCYAHVAANLISFTSNRSIAPLALAVQISTFNESSWDASSAGEVVDAIRLVNSGAGLCSTAGYNSRNLTDSNFKIPSTTPCTGVNLARPEPMSVKFYRDCLSGQVPRRYLPPEFKDSILAAINAELTRLRPVGISLNLTTLALPVESSSDSGVQNHIVSIIGKTWVNNRCEFVIRNSYGTSGCSTVFNPSQVNCQKTVGFPDGTFSIDESKLREALHRVVILKENGPALSNPIEQVTPNICREDTSVVPPSSAPKPTEDTVDNNDLEDPK